MMEILPDNQRSVDEIIAQGLEAIASREEKRRKAKEKKPKGINTSSKSAFRNILRDEVVTKRGIEGIFLTRKEFKRDLAADVTLFDGLTSMRMALPTSVESVIKQQMSSALIGKIKRQCDKYFDKGSMAVVWMVDKREYVPITKGVVQKNRVTSAEGGISIDNEEADLEVLRNLASTDLELVESHAERKRVADAAVALEKHNFRVMQRKETAKNITLLDVDEPRKTLRDRFDEFAHEQLMNEYWDTKVAEEGIDIYDAVENHQEMDDLFVLQKLLEFAREMPLPQPWDTFIRSSGHPDASRDRIMRYVVLSLTYDRLQAYRPPPGKHLIIDGHYLPQEWLPDPKKITPIDENAQDRRITQMNLDTDAAIILSHPETPRLPEHYLDKTLGSAKKPPGDLAPCISYCNYYRNHIGEADHAAFYYIERMMHLVKDDHSETNDAENSVSNEYSEKCNSFIIVSKDTDLLMMALYYLAMKKFDMQTVPQLYIVASDKPELPKDYDTIDINKLSDYITDNILGGDYSLMFDFVHASFASDSDYTVGYMYAPPNMFYNAFREGIVPLYHSGATMMHTTSDDQVECDEPTGEETVGFLSAVKRLNARGFGRRRCRMSYGQYRNLVAATYFQTHKKKFESGDVRNCPEIESFQALYDVWNERVRDSGDLLDFIRHALTRCNKKWSAYYEKFLIDPMDDSAWPVDVKEFNSFAQHVVGRMVPCNDQVYARYQLLANAADMLCQLGSATIEIQPPLENGFEPVDPDRELSATNIKFTASKYYEKNCILTARNARLLQGMDWTNET